MYPPDERRESQRQQSLFEIRQIRAVHFRGGSPYESRDPCPDCGITHAYIVVVNGQNSIHCTRCDRHLYNAPKTETGERQRSMQTVRAGIKPSQQARILNRDHRRCVLCGQSDVVLTVGHLLSINEGMAIGATDAELNDDANLAAMCETCNAGLGMASVSPATYAAIMYRLVLAEMTRERRG